MFLRRDSWSYRVDDPDVGIHLVLQNLASLRASALWLLGLKVTFTYLQYHLES